MSDLPDIPEFDPETGEIIEPGGGDKPPAPTVMSLDDARALLVREHDTAIGSDDPLLMSVTLHQGFIRDYEAMLHRHDAGIKAILGATGEACAKAVEDTLAGLKDKAVKANLEQAFALVAEQARTMERLNRSMRRHSLFNGFLSLISLTGAVVALFLLFSILR